MKQLKLLLLFLFISFSAVAQTTEKKVILQGFWWDYFNANHNDSWANYLCELAPRLKSLGVDAVWIPPTYKNAGTNSVGYAPFDHYDLGDKYQKGDTRTRVGTKDEVLRMIAVLHANGIEVIQDVVLNHVTNAGTNNGAGGQDPETTYSMQTDGGFKNFRYVSYETPVPLTGGENAAEYLNRKGRWSKNYMNFHPNPSWNVTTGNWEEAHWGPDFSYGVDQTGLNNGFGLSTNATYNPIQNYNYNRDQARNWLMWYVRQTGVDGFRWDAVKHYPHFVVQDLSYNVKYLNGFANLGEGMINFGEYVGGKMELDNYVNDVRYSNGGQEMLAGTFDFGLRGTLKGVIDAQGAYDLSAVPAAQQNERVTHYPASNTYVHRTVPFVNNHDTFRPIKDSNGNYTGWDGANEIGGHIEPNEPRLSAIYALAFALDGTPLVFFEDLFNIGYNNNGYSHDPTSATSLPVQSDLENILWCHQNLDFATGPYVVRGHSGNQGDHLIIERGGKALVGINDNWNTWQIDWVDSDFAPGTILVDYSGANGSTTATVQNDQRVQISTPPCDGSATNGRRGYSIWGPQGIATTYTPQRTTTTTQEWEMANDLGDSNCNSLQQGGALPDNSTAYRNVGKIFVNNIDPILYELNPDDATKNLTIELFDLNGNSLTSQSGLGTLTGTFTATQIGWIDIKIRNTNANQTGQKCWVKMTYIAPETVDVAQYPVLPDVATWTGTASNDWIDCRNWEFGLIPNEQIDVLIPSNSNFIPKINSGFESCKNLTIDNNATLEVNGGTFNIKGNLINNGTITSIGNCGAIIFNGTTTQNIDGSPTTFCNVRFNNSNGVTLNTDLTVTTQLELSQGGKLFIEDNNLYISSTALVLAGNGHVVTKDNPTSGGHIIREVGSTALLFPVGTANSYTPAYITSNNGTTTYKVRAFDKVYNNGNVGGIVADLNKTIQQTWSIEPENGNMDADIQLYWNASDEGTSYSRTSSMLLRNSGNFWFGVPSSTVNGNNSPYSQTANNVMTAGYFTVSTGIVSTKPILAKNTTFSISPNPSNGYFEIINNEIINRDLQVVIYNAIGEEILSLNGKLATINKILQQQKMANGIYFLSIKTEATKFETLKIVIQ